MKAEELYAGLYSYTSFTTPLRRALGGTGNLEACGMRPLRALVDYDEARAVATARPPDAGSAAPFLERAIAQFCSPGMRGWERRALAARAAASCKVRLLY